MIFALLIYRVFTARIDDKIDQWIGVDYQFPSYSGLIELGDVNQKVIHYVFLESQNQPATDPLIIWLGGGPGCTSLFGLAGDIGPFVFDGNNDNLINNPFSLIKKANLLFIETPAGVGYSTINDVNFKFDDTINGQDNLLFLQKWIVLFTEYIDHNIWIGGASYAGMYVPFFAKQIVNSSTFKLKGIMVGNGVIVEGGKFILDTYNQYMLQRSFYDIKTQSELEKICPKYPNSAYKVVTKRKPFANKSNNNLAGWITEYNYLRFVVLRSAGHLAASYQRENAYQMFSDFLGWNV
ncbi:hypothetical protein pb186bvf_004388 [Paramecium bursaria]